MALCLWQSSKTGKPTERSNRRKRVSLTRGLHPVHFDFTYVAPWAGDLSSDSEECDPSFRESIVSISVRSMLIPRKNPFYRIHVLFMADTISVTHFVWSPTPQMLSRCADWCSSSVGAYLKPCNMSYLHCVLIPDTSPLNGFANAWRTWKSWKKKEMSRSKRANLKKLSANVRDA